MSLRHLLDQRFEIQRRTRIADGQGGHTEAYASVAFDVAGRLRTLTASERILAQREEVRLSHVFYAGPDLDLEQDDRLLVGAQTVTVLSVRQPSRRGHHLEADCEEIVRGS